MKKFLSGFLSCAIIMTLALSVMAITGKTTIDVYPIDIMVNGEVFQPTNAQGKPVDVFTYKGTTYAPLRALAKAYGLEVGYDAEKKLATVSEPEATPTPDTTAKPDYSDWSAEDEAAYQEFREMWECGIKKHVDGVGITYAARYSGDLDYPSFREKILAAGEDVFERNAIRFLMEQENINEETVTVMFFDADNHVVGRCDRLYFGETCFASLTGTFTGTNKSL